MKFLYYSRQLHEKGSIVRLHCHLCYELVFCINGYCQVNYNSKKNNSIKSSDRVVYVQNSQNPDKHISFCENSIIIFEPTIIHNEYYVNQKTEMLSIGFMPDENTFPFNQIQLDENGKLKKFLLKIEEAYINKEYNYISDIQAYLTLLLNELTRLAPRSNMQQSSLPNIDYEINYFNEYFTSNINFETLANRSGYCRDHFAVLFKKKTGLSPKQYIIKKRMELAMFLINNSNLSLKEISEECGYNDYFQFSTYFKKYYGNRPSIMQK